MVLLSQSRGSVLGIGAALAVYALLARERARALVWLAIALLSALIVIPALTDLYATANDVALNEAVPEMRSAGKAALVGAAVAVLLAMLAMLLERRLRPSAEAERRADRFAGGALIAAVVVGGIAFVVAVGNPIDFFEEKVDEFRTEGTPGFQGEASRFTFSAGTERLDLWGVALEDAGRDPLFGEGAGGFQYSYMRERSATDQNARDAHSVELEILSELGLPGLALFGTAIVAMVTGAMRSRRRARRPRESRPRRSHRGRTGSPTRRSTGSGHTRGSPPRSSCFSVSPAARPSSRSGNGAVPGGDGSRSGPPSSG